MDDEKNTSLLYKSNNSNGILTYAVWLEIIDVCWSIQEVNIINGIDLKDFIIWKK